MLRSGDGSGYATEDLQMRQNDFSVDVFFEFSEDMLRVVMRSKVGPLAGGLQCLLGSPQRSVSPPSAQGGVQAATSQGPLA